MSKASLGIAVSILALSACGGESESDSSNGSGGSTGSGAKSGIGGGHTGGTSGDTGGTGGPVGGSGGAVGGSSGTGGSTGGSGGNAGSASGGVAGSSASDPGIIPCGSYGPSTGGGPTTTNCGVWGTYCCDHSMQPNDEECLVDSDTSCSGFRRSCNEVADCQPGYVCCSIPAQANFYVYSTTCMPNCDSFFPQICKTDEECKNGQPCISQQCNGWTVQACGGIPSQLECK